MVHVKVFTDVIAAQSTPATLLFKHCLNAFGCHRFIPRGPDARAHLLRISPPRVTCPPFLCPFSGARPNFSAALVFLMPRLDQHRVAFSISLLPLAAGVPHPIGIFLAAPFLVGAILGFSFRRLLEDLYPFTDLRLFTPTFFNNPCMGFDFRSGTVLRVPAPVPCKAC